MPGPWYQSLRFWSFLVSILSFLPPMFALCRIRPYLLRQRWTRTWPVKMLMIVFPYLLLGLLLPWPLIWLLLLIYSLSPVIFHQCILCLRHSCASTYSGDRLQHGWHAAGAQERQPRLVGGRRVAPACINSHPILAHIFSEHCAPTCVRGGDIAAVITIAITIAKTVAILACLE